ncbi:DUF4258 domain-containing protein [Thiocapsa rosea]|uniref:Uncharacterized protein DUF4258 n=1 Tax=Thiocapsa rosea TaxID=69360 RepID=A0A495VCT1_9GAMM|nr:DUF4258 domain-containing protein [Thiocapsa rosea]RKT47216.1 uncharacterized protein DUF4258 [Thiocapsa rosea]
MSDTFHSDRFGKKVWLTNHAIESMAKRRVTLDEVKTLIEQGTYLPKTDRHGWISHQCDARDDNLICAAIFNGDAVIVKTVMVNWTVRSIP